MDPLNLLKEVKKIKYNNLESLQKPEFREEDKNSAEDEAVHAPEKAIKRRIKRTFKDKMALELSFFQS